MLKKLMVVIQGFPKQTLVVSLTLNFFEANMEEFNPVNFLRQDSGKMCLSVGYSSQG